MINTKINHLLQIAKDIHKEFNGEIPYELEPLRNELKPIINALIKIDQILNDGEERTLQ